MAMPQLCPCPRALPRPANSSDAAVDHLDRQARAIVAEMEARGMFRDFPTRREDRR